MSKEPLEKLKGKKGIYSMWKKGGATWEEYRDVVRVCRDATRKAKGPLGIKTGRGSQGQQEGLFSSTSAAKGRLGKMWSRC